MKSLQEYMIDVENSSLKDRLLMIKILEKNGQKMSVDLQHRKGFYDHRSYYALKCFRFYKIDQAFDVGSSSPNILLKDFLKKFKHMLLPDLY